MVVGGFKGVVDVTSVDADVDWDVGDAEGVSAGVK